MLRCTEASLKVYSFEMANHSFKCMLFGSSMSKRWVPVQQCWPREVVVGGTLTNQNSRITDLLVLRNITVWQMTLQPVYADLVRGVRLHDWPRQHVAHGSLQVRQRFRQ